MAEILRRFWVVSLPDGFTGFLTVIGFIALVIIFLILMAMVVAITSTIIEQRRARKLAAKILINPKTAYREIIKQEKLIAEFDKESEVEQVKRRKLLVEQLVKSQEEFTKNFPYIKQEDIRQHFENISSANR